MFRVHIIEIYYHVKGDCFSCFRHFVGNDETNTDKERTQIYYVVETSSETSIWHREGV